MLKVFPFTFILSVLFLELSCGSGNNKVDPIRSTLLKEKEQEKEQEKKKENTNYSLFVVDQKNKYLKFNRSSIGVDFLLRTNFIDGGSSPSFHGMKTRIVYFEVKQDKLYMFERPYGHVNYHESEQSLILASYPIESITAEYIEFDFAKGVKELFTLGDWYAQDLSGSKHSHMKTGYKSLPIKKTYIEKIIRHKEKENGIQLNVKSQLGGTLNSNTSIEIRFFLEKYEENKNFIPTKSEFEKNDRAYFEIEPLIDSDQNHVTYASKFDITKPIVFAISSNTPPDYRRAIKEGILYWNKSFDSEIIKVIDAPEGVCAPDYEYNIVQWIEWKDAGFAYADAQMDPKTGEILNAQVYLSSSFAINSNKKARRLIKNLNSRLQKLSLNEDDIHKINDRKNHINISASHLLDFNKKHKHSEHHNGCEHPFPEGFMSHLEQLAEQGASSKDYLKLSQHYIREVVAHEIGHTLGLRHNFAGSLHSDLTREQKSENFKSLIENDNLLHEEAITSSVMDYLVFEDSVISGYQIKNQKKPFDYDYKAIQKLYYTNGLQRQKSIVDFSSDPLFCTDSQIYRYVDCKPFFVAKDPFQHTRQMLKNNFELLPHILASNFNKKISQSSRPDLMLVEVFPDSYLFNLAFYLLAPVFNTLNALQDFSGSLQSRDKLGEAEDFDQIIPKNELHLRWTVQKLKENKNLFSILEHESLFDENKIIAKFSESLMDEFSLGGENEASKNFYLSSKKEIHKRLFISLVSFKKVLKKIEILQLLFVRFLSDENIEPYNTSLSHFFSDYLLEKSIDYIFSDKGTHKVRGHHEFVLELPSELATLIPAKHRKFYLDVPKDVSLHYPQAKNMAASLVKKMFSSLLGPANNKGKNDIQDNKSLDNLKIPLKDRVESDSFYNLTINTPLDFNIVDFKYSNDIRLLAAFLLSPNKNKSFTFGIKNRAVLARLFSQLIKADNSGLLLQKVDLSLQPTKVSEWVLANRKIQDILTLKSIF